jgi:2-amino-4-hydroxy-6-hydroxymethyldihydropteridine diphosphokinase
MGRTRKRHRGEGYSDRVIDLDLLLYDDLHLETERLVLPHPHIADRDFVRLPLEECQAFIRNANLSSDSNEISTI